MAGLSDLLREGGATFRQLFVWGMMESVVQALVSPYLRALEYEVNQKDPNAVLSPEALADLVVKGWLDQAAAAKTAEKSGVDGPRFTQLVEGTGEPIPLELALEYWRRGFMPWTSDDPSTLSVVAAIRQSHLRSDWSKVIHQGHLTPPSTANAVEAVLRNQVSETEGLAMAWYAGLGVHDLSLPTDPAVDDTRRAFDILKDTAGNPPSYTELLDMVRRGLIEWGTLTPGRKAATPAAKTFAQGIYEGNNKDKWLPEYAGLYEAIPSEYYILTFLKDGAMTVTVATRLLQMRGYSAGVISGIVQSATASAVSTDKKLTEGLIKELYTGRVLDRTEASQLLTDIGYGPQAVTFVLMAWDLTFQVKQTSAALTKVRSLYLAKKIDATVAREALTAYGITATAADQVLTTWGFEREATVRLLTESQIVDAWEYGVMSAGDAYQSLQDIGYTPYDAWVVMSVKAKAPAPTIPPPPRVNSGIGTAT